MGMPGSRRPVGLIHISSASIHCVKWQGCTKVLFRQIDQYCPSALIRGQLGLRRRDNYRRRRLQRGAAH